MSPVDPLGDPVVAFWNRLGSTAGRFECARCGKTIGTFLSSTDPEPAPHRLEECIFYLAGELRRVKELAQVAVDGVCPQGAGR